MNFHVTLELHRSWVSDAHSFYIFSYVFILGSQDSTALIPFLIRSTTWFQGFRSQNWVLKSPGVITVITFIRKTWDFHASHQTYIVHAPKPCSAGGVRVSDQVQWSSAGPCRGWKILEAFMDWQWLTNFDKRLAEWPTCEKLRLEIFGTFQTRLSFSEWCCKHLEIHAHAISVISGFGGQGALCRDPFAKQRYHEHFQLLEKLSKILDHFCCDIWCILVKAFHGSKVL